MNAPAAPSGVKLPAAVQREVDRANQMIKDLNAPPGTQPAQAAPRAPDAPPPPPPAQAAAPEPVSVEEQLRRANARYESLQGKYNAETSALRSQVQQNTDLVRDLLARRDEPPAQPASVPAAQSPEDFLKSIGATEQDIKDYGELLPIVVRLAQNMYKPTIEKLEKELSQLRNSAAQANSASVEERKQQIWDALDRAVPAWRTINEEEHFLDWLRVVDIFSGVTRHVALASAFKNLDRARVVAIFEAYAREHPEQARAPGAPIVDPATLVAPVIRGDQPPAAPEGSGSKKIWTEAEIQHFYTRVRKKAVSQQEYDNFQAEIALATREGRIKPSRPDHHANR